MKKINKIIGIAVCCITVIVFGIVSLMKDEPASEGELTFDEVPLDQQKGTLSDLDTKVYTQKKTGPKTLIKPHNLTNQINPEETLEESIRYNKKVLAEMSENYEMLSKYPSYSMPLAAEQLDLIEPNQYIPVRRTIGDNFKADARLSQYQLAQGDPIDPHVTIYSKNIPIPRTTLEVSVHTDTDEKLIKIEMVLTEDEPNHRRVYKGSATPNSEQMQNWPTDLNLSVHLNIEGETPIRMFDPFRYINPVATLAPGTSPHVEGSHLIIPMTIQAKEKGWYSLRGILYSKEGKPLIHLENKSEIQEESGAIEIKAHVSALKAHNDEGPYVFKPNKLEKLRGFLGDPKKEGSSKIKEITIPKFDFSDYTDEVFEDPVIKQKAEFFKKLSKQ